MWQFKLDLNLKFVENQENRLSCVLQFQDLVQNECIKLKCTCCNG